MQLTGTIYLIPTYLGNTNETLISEHNKQAIYSIKHFIVESEKSARSFLKSIKHPIAQSDFEFFDFNEHNQKQAINQELFQILAQGNHIGLLSDAGMPCIADPGNKIIAEAHLLGYHVKTMGGLSSIFMALMASGFSGQNFTFHGYLPIDRAQKVKKLREIDQQLYKTGYTQIFIETPYRNINMVKDLYHILSANIMLSVSSGLTSDNETTICQTLSDWKQTNIDYLHKNPAVFILGKAEKSKTGANNINFANV